MLPKCDDTECNGHLGKHDSCLSEALWCASVDYADEYGGDSGDFGAYMLLFLAYEGFDVPGEVWGENRDYRVSAGTFATVTQVSSGQVFVQCFDTDTDAQWAYDDHMRLYAIWEEANGY